MKKKIISLKISRIWLKKLGLVSQSQKKGIYFDNYERKDVLEYHEVFLKQMKEYKQFMPIFIGDKMK